MNTKDEIISDSTKYVGSTYITIPLSIAASIIRKRFLGPTQIGIWNGLLILKMYSSFSELGVLRSAEREMPYFLGQRNQKHFELTKNTTFSSVLLSSLIVNLIIFLVTFFIKGPSHLVLVGIRVIALVSLLQSILSFFTVAFLRAKKNFTLLSKQILFAEIINICLTTILAYYFKIYGVYVSATAILIFSISYIYINTEFKLKFSIEKNELLRLVKIGIPLLLYAIVVKTFINIDKLMILKMISVTALGYYSIATMVAIFISDLPIALAVVIFPRLQETFAQTRNIKDIKKYVLTPTLVLAYLIPLFIGLFYVIVPLLVKYVLPQFYDGISAMKILIFGSFFFALVFSPNQFLITLDKQWKALVLVSVVLMIGFLLNLFFISIGWGINGVALATSIAHFVYSTLLIGYALSHFSQKTEIIFFFIKIYLPFLYVFLLLWGLDKAIVLNPEWALRKDLFFGLLKIIFLIFLNVPLLYYINKKTEVVKLFFSNLNNFFSRLTTKEKKEINIQNNITKKF